MIAVLCYLQPLVQRFVPVSGRGCSPGGPNLEGLPSSGRATDAAVRAMHCQYWSETWDERTALLNRLTAYLSEHRWGKAIDAGWSEWDLKVACYPWSTLRVCTVQEDHGSGNRLIRVRYRQKPSGWIVPAGALAAVGIVVVVTGPVGWPIAAGGIALTGIALFLWRAATQRAGHLMAVLDAPARDCFASLPRRRQPTPRVVKVTVSRRQGSDSNANRT